MLALAQSVLNRAWAEFMAEIWYVDDEGYADLTSYGESMMSLSADDLLEILLPKISDNPLTDSALELLCYWMFGTEPPPPPQQMSLL